MGVVSRPRLPAFRSPDLSADILWFELVETRFAVPSSDHSRSVQWARQNRYPIALNVHIAEWRQKAPPNLPCIVDCTLPPHFLSENGEGRGGAKSGSHKSPAG